MVSSNLDTYAKNALVLGDGLQGIIVTYQLRRYSYVPLQVVSGRQLDVPLAEHTETALNLQTIWILIALMR